MATRCYCSNYDFPKLTNFAELSSSYRQSVWSGDLSLGLVLKQERAYSNVSEHIYFPSVSLSTGLESARTRNGEGQLDYQHGLGDYGQMQLFAVHRLTEQDEISQTHHGSRHRHVAQPLQPARGCGAAGLA